MDMQYGNLINANERERCSAQQLAGVRGIVPRPQGSESIRIMMWYVL